MAGIGLTEVIVVLVIVLILFGAQRLPQLGRGLGEGIRNFRSGLKDDAGNGAKEADPTKPPDANL